MTTKNIKQATIIIELDNGEFAAMATKNEAIITLCATLLKFVKLPKEYVENLSFEEIDWEKTLKD